MVPKRIVFRCTKCLELLESDEQGFIFLSIGEDWKSKWVINCAYCTKYPPSLLSKREWILTNAISTIYDLYAEYDRLNFVLEQEFEQLVKMVYYNHDEVPLV